MHSKTSTISSWYEQSLLEIYYSDFFKDSPEGRTVKSKIIPCLAYLRNKYPLHFRVLFHLDFLRGFCPGFQLDTIDCTDIAFTDSLFDRFLYK